MSALVGFNVVNACDFCREKKQSKNTHTKSKPTTRVTRKNVHIIFVFFDRANGQKNMYALSDVQVTGMTKV